jgi:ABC-type nitrate/sulfonate/bicarbonate transport system substrate-binding protein
MTALDRLAVATFSGASSLPLFIALELRLFERFGIDVDLTTVRNSDQLMEGLLDGTFPIVHSAPDNFIAWRDRTGRDIVAWTGGASGPLSLVAAPDVPSLNALRGRAIAVDSPESGFVSTLRLLLRSGGIAEDEIRLDPLGATQLRFKALVAGDTGASMLSLPWSLLAMEQGCHILGQQSDVLPRLQGSCGASLEGWLAENGDLADRYLRALVAALTAAYTGELPAADIRRLLRDRYGIEDRHAEIVRAAFIDPVHGWPPSALIDADGMEAVCRLRADAGRPPRSSAKTYYTLEPYRRLFGAPA